MNSRDRFLEIMNFNTSIRTLDWEFGYWGGTVEKWYKEGLKNKYGLDFIPGYADAVCGPGITWPLGEEEHARDRDISDQIGFDKGFEKVNINTFLYPKFTEKIIEEIEDKVVFIDEMGVKKVAKKDSSSTPEILSGPIKDEKDWDKLKEERLQVRYSKRKVKNWNKLITKYRNRDFPLSISGPIVGFFGVLRFLFGEPQVYYMYYDNPKLIHKINSHLCDMWINLFSEVLSETDVDCAHFWEDMSGRQGSLISEVCFKEFMSPYYKRLTDFLKSRGVKYFFVDTDGDVNNLIHLFLECGVNGTYPFEVQAGSDIVEIRKKYPDLLIMGGLDKRILSKSKKEIEIELEKKLPFMLSKGGYIPYADHIIPPDASWENFIYYRNKVKDYIRR